MLYHSRKSTTNHRVFRDRHSGIFRTFKSFLRARKEEQDVQVKSRIFYILLEIYTLLKMNKTKVEIYTDVFGHVSANFDSAEAFTKQLKRSVIERIYLWKT